MTYLILVVVAALLGCCGCSTAPEDNGTPSESSAESEASDEYTAFVEAQGWRKEFKRGRLMVRELTRLDPKGRRNYDVAALRGQLVAFVAAAAPPGGTNDLVTGGGFYLRVVNPQKKDLRPHAVSWSAIVRGKILQVLPENNIIVLEVETEDWITLDTT